MTNTTGDRCFNTGKVMIGIGYDPELGTDPWRYMNENGLFWQHILTTDPETNRRLRRKQFVQYLAAMAGALLALIALIGVIV